MDLKKSIQNSGRKTLEKTSLNLLQDNCYKRTEEDWPPERPMVQRPISDDAASPVGGGHHREPPPITSHAASNRLGIGIGYSQMHQNAGYNKLFTQSK
uniref:CSON002794 protein n=1 Tax=Culicoides sonorensis TaxID=179676 RepID=A0A336ML96_CULSO